MTERPLATSRLVGGMTVLTLMELDSYRRSCSAPQVPSVAVDDSAVHILWDQSNIFHRAQDVCDDQRGGGLEPGALRRLGWLGRAVGAPARRPQFWRLCPSGWR